MWRVRHCHTAHLDPSMIPGVTDSTLPGVDLVARFHRSTVSRSRIYRCFETRPLFLRISGGTLPPFSLFLASRGVAGCYGGARAYDVGGNSTHGGYARCLADVFPASPGSRETCHNLEYGSFPEERGGHPPKTPSKTTKPTSPVSPDSNFPRLVRRQVHSPHLHDWRHSRGRSHDTRRGAESPVTSGWG